MGGLKNVGSFGVLFFTALTVTACRGYRPVSFYAESVARSAGPEFSFRILNFLKEGNPKTDFYLAVSNSVLQFSKTGDRYTASYSVAVRVLSKEEDSSKDDQPEAGRIVVERSWTETITESSYEATTGRAFHVSPRTFVLQPGGYSVVAEVTDELSKRSIRRSRTLEVPNYESVVLSVSTITIGSRFVRQDGEEKLIPDIIPEMSTTIDLHHAYFEIYDKLPGRLIDLSAKLYRVDQYDTFLFLSPHRRDEIARKLPDSLFWAAESTLTSGSTLPVRIVLPPLATGHYRFELMARPKEGAPGAGEHEVRSVQTFSVWPMGFPEIVTLDQQIEVLAHIATNEEFQHLLEARTKEDKRQRLRDFWTKRWDRDEYYRRAEYANRYFSCMTEGWRTAFGWAYMVLGPPDDIQLAPRGVERWRYSLGSNRMLVIPFVIKDYVVADAKCKSGAAFLDPVVQRELVLRWRKTD